MSEVQLKRASIPPVAEWLDFHGEVIAANVCRESLDLINELQAKVEELTASRDYWKNHWEQAYSEQHGSDPALKESE